MSLVATALAAGAPGAPDPAVRGVSMEVNPGEWVALTGANGCGKTSVALTLAGLWPALAGEVTLAGEPIAAAHARGRVAAVLQEPASQLLEPTVADELAFTARNLDLPREAIERESGRWAECFGLTPDLAADPRSLAAGRQQLVLIAAAMISRPGFLVADEAAAHLDREARETVLAELRREVQAGLGVLWVTQEASEVARADRVIVMGAGGRPRGVPACRTAPVSEATALRIVVAPWDGRSGPHVSCGQPLTIEVPARGVLGLVGRNGAGKSVLLSAVAGLLEIPQVVVSPAPLEPPPILATQYPELQAFEEHVADEVAFAAVARGAERDRVMAAATRAFDRLGLPGKGFLGRRAFELSAGEKRLVQAVAALVAPASVVLLDEPTAGLDPERRLALAGLVAERAERDPVLVAGQDGEWMGWAGAGLQAVGDPQQGPKELRGSYGEIIG